MFHGSDAEHSQLRHNMYYINVLIYYKVGTYIVCIVLFETDVVICFVVMGQSFTWVL